MPWLVRYKVDPSAQLVPWPHILTEDRTNIVADMYFRTQLLTMVTLASFSSALSYIGCKSNLLILAQYYRNSLVTNCFSSLQRATNLHALTGLSSRTLLLQSALIRSYSKAFPATARRSRLASANSTLEPLSSGSNVRIVVIGMHAILDDCSQAVELDGLAPRRVRLVISARIGTLTTPSASHWYAETNLVLLLLLKHEFSSLPHR